MYFISPTFPGLQPHHAAWNKTAVLQEGDPGTLRDDVVSAPSLLAGEIAVPGDQQEAEINPDVFFAQNILFPGNRVLFHIDLPRFEFQYVLEIR